MEHVTYIFIGWLLGLLSPIIVSYFKGKIRTDEFKKSAISELKDMQMRLSISSFILKSKYGSVKPEYVQWLDETLSNYPGFEKLETAKKMFSKLSSMDEDEFSSAIDEYNSLEQRDSSTLKKYNIMYVRQHIGELSKLPSAVQLKFYELFQNIDIINQRVETVSTQSNMTFDSSITEENHARLKENIKQAYLDVGNSCERAARKINDIVLDIQ